MNIKKIGLTALAGSLVATSAFAGEMSVAGGASITVEHKNGTAADSGTRCRRSLSPPRKSYHHFSSLSPSQTLSLYGAPRARRSQPGACWW